jgi:sulfate adenylyltransferase subunit 1
MLVKENNLPEVGQDIEAMICWMSEKPLQVNGKYLIRHTSKECKCLVKEVRYKMNINTLHKIEEEKVFEKNDIGRIMLRTALPLFYDSYRKNRTTGSFILVEEGTNITVGAGMII